MVNPVEKHPEFSQMSSRTHQHVPPGLPDYRFEVVSSLFEESALLSVLRDTYLRYRRALVESYLHDATIRLGDPVYAFFGYIDFLNGRMSELERHIHAARDKLSEVLDFINQPYQQWRGHRTQAAAVLAPLAREQDRDELFEVLGFLNQHYQQPHGYRTQAAAAVAPTTSIQQAAMLDREQDRLRSFRQDSWRPGGIGGDGGASSMINLELGLRPYNDNVSRVQQPPPQPYHHHHHQPLPPQPQPRWQRRRGRGGRT